MKPYTAESNALTIAPQYRLAIQPPTVSGFSEYTAMKSIGLQRVPTFDKYIAMKYDDTVEYRNVLARYHNLTGQRDWSAVEFNPDTASDHFERHGHDTGFQSEEEYKSAAVNFINSPEEKLSFIDADGIKRYFSVDSGYFASVYPDGTVRTFFKPRKGIKYWEGQVNKYDTEG